MPLPKGADIGSLTVWLLVDAFLLAREVSYGALALLLWDMCLTFADEVGTSLPYFVFNLLRSTNEPFPIGRFNMVCKVGRYKRPVSRQPLRRAGDDLPRNLECASGHKFVDERPY